MSDLRVWHKVGNKMTRQHEYQKINRNVCRILNLKFRVAAAARQLRVDDVLKSR